MKRKYKMLVLLGTFVIFAMAVSQHFILDAQIRGFGSACTSNYTPCTSGLTNFRQAIENGSSNFRIFGTHFDKSAILTAIDQRYGSFAAPALIYNRALCVDRNTTDGFNGDIIPFWRNIAYETLEITDGRVNQSVIAIRGCVNYDGIRFSASNAVISAGLVGVGDYDSWGCCPSGSGINYQFVTRGDGLFADPGDVQELSACCAIPSGAVEGDLNYPTYYTKALGGIGDGGTCRGKEGADVWGTAAQLEYPALSGSGIPYVYDARSRSGAPPYDQLIWGRALGYSNNPTDTDFRIRVNPNTGSDKSCSNLEGCAIVPATTPTTGGVTVTQFTSFGNELGVIDPSFLETTPRIQCNQCYEPGEAMFIEDPVVGSISQLVMCAGDGATLKRDLINNNIADTLAVLQAEKANDPTNAAFIANCRAQGGIPTAIGCIDTTPVGIITGLIRTALGTMGGVALIQLIIVGLTYQRGDEAKIKEARSKLFATITGVVTLVFSVLLLRILGVNILDIIPSGTI